MDGKPTNVLKKARTINAVDLFCGAGGTSSGLIRAVHALGHDIKLTAINHWDVAIATHSRNHGDVEHFCQSIESVNPTDVIKGGRLQLLVASPECVHHSNARGGKPRSDQKRADAWLLMRWIEKLYVENLLIENVKEFMSWGPLTAFGRPDKRYKGQYFQAFVDQLRINYTVEWRILNCADYGDPTTRERFFLIAKRGKGKKIQWPVRTHIGRKELAKLLKTDPAAAEEAKSLKPWVPARKIIDWSQQGTSIFGRKKPLSPNTLKRIFAGLKRYSGIEVDYDHETGKIRSVKISKPQDGSDAFIVPQFSTGVPRDINEPIGALTTTSRGVGLTEAFQLNLKGTDRRDRGIDDPTFTQAAGGNHQGVVEPFIVATGHTSANGINARDISEPVPSVLGSPRLGVVEAEPFLVKNFSGSDESRSKSVEEPLGTVAANFNHHYLVEPEQFLLTVDQPLTNRSAPRSLEEPIPTITGSPRVGMVESDAFVFNMAHTGDKADETRHQSYCKDTQDPLPTVAGKGMFGLVESQFLSSFHGGPGGDDRNYPIDEPVKTIDTSNRFALVQAEPVIVPACHSDTNAAHSVDDPLRTVLGTDKFGVAQPFIVSAAHGGNTNPPRDIDEPLGAVLGTNKFGIAEPCIVSVAHGGDSYPPRDVDEPLGTILGKGKFGVAEPFIVKFYSSGENADSVDAPLATVTARDRFGLCVPELGVILDIRFRMLQPHELAAAMSFPPEYEFTGNREDRVKQIGNAVPLCTSEALVKAILSK